MGTTERLVVEIELGSEPISGLIRRLEAPGEAAGPLERAMRFTGYMELIAAVERAIGNRFGREIEMNTYAILRRSGWRSPEDLEEAVARSKRVGDEEMSDQVRWIRSYAMAEESGGLGTVCIYQASSPEAIREHASRALLPVDEIVEVADTLVVRPDPEQAKA